MTAKELARSLNVPLGDVVKALMDLGLMTTATQELTAEDVGFVTKLIRLDEQDEQ